MKVRPAKVATIDEVKAKVEETSTAVVTEYRGLTVTEIQSLRKELRSLDADYKVFKNTLVKRAIAGTSSEGLSDFLEGPTAIAFVKGDISAVAKALKNASKATPALIVKGGVVDGKTVTLAELAALADLPSREVMLAQLAGLIASPLRTMAGLIKAVPQNFAYGLSALVKQGGGVAAPATATEPAAETPAGVEEAAPAASDDAAAETAEVAEEAVVTAETETTEAPSEDAASEPAE
jgi:large subunit ribosomal protein L10